MSVVTLRSPWLSYEGGRQINIDAKDNYGMTALHSACHKGHTEIAMALIDEGADIDAKKGILAGQLYTGHVNGHTEIMWLS
jgi:ankyrin repeat protein